MQIKRSVESVADLRSAPASAHDRLTTTIMSYTTYGTAALAPATDPPVSVAIGLDQQPQLSLSSHYPLYSSHVDSYQHALASSSASSAAIVAVANSVLDGAAAIAVPSSSTATINGTTTTVSVNCRHKQ